MNPQDRADLLDAPWANMRDDDDRDDDREDEFRRRWEVLGDVGSE